MAYLAESRVKMKLPIEGCIEIRRDANHLDTVFGDGVYMQCLPCGDELTDNAERSLFECGSCGFTVTGDEANALATDYVRALSSIFVIHQKEEERKGFLWRLLTLFGSKRKRRALTS
jgi:predicted RNA-binding Zn-ribbon protein involved in translation (DUF1610 family)